MYLFALCPKILISGVTTGTSALKKQVLLNLGMMGSPIAEPEAEMILSERLKPSWLTALCDGPPAALLPYVLCKGVGSKNK